jgi:hypothetical protein
MAVDFDAWVADIAKKGSLTAEELSTVKAVFSKPGVKQELVDSVERQSDYSRKMQELQRQREEEDNYAARLIEWEKESKARLTAAEQQANAYKNQVYALAQQYNVSPEELQKHIASGAVQVPAATPTPTPVDQSKWITKEQVDEYATAMFKINAQLIGLNQEHIRLFGKPMDRLEEFVDEALKAGRPVGDTFRQFYKVTDRETELREQEIQARITAAVNEAKNTWITNGASPIAANTNIPKGWQSPVMENVEGLDAKALGDQAAHRTRVQETIAAFNAEQVRNGLPTL